MEKKLCKACQEFDYIMNGKDGISFDVFVVCDHLDEKSDLFRDKYGDLESNEDPKCYGRSMHEKKDGFFVQTVVNGKEGIKLMNRIDIKE